MSARNQNFLCPITQCEMVDPVLAPDGITYERNAIEKWFSLGHNTSPMTRQVLPSQALIPNIALRAMIQEAGVVAPPAAAAIPAAALPTPTVSVTTITGTDKHQISVTMTDTTAEACLPLTLLFVGDISGSMGTASTDKASDAAMFSRADLLKHSAATMIETLRSHDKLALILFDDRCEMVLPPTLMNPSGRLVAKSCLPQIAPRGGTNIWGGLRKALEIAAAEDPACERNVAIIFQTDGESDPSYNPPRGIRGELMSFMERHPEMRVTIHTVGYGFGQRLDTPLLRAIAETGRGTYNYICDGSMVGTVFSHLFANLMSVVHLGLTLHVPELGYTERIGFLQSGQKLGYAIAAPAGPYTVILKDHRGAVLASQAVTPDATPVSPGFSMIRQETIRCLQEALAIAETGRTADAAAAVLAARIRAQVAAPDAFTAELLTDLTDPGEAKGQIGKAFATRTAYDRWGRHYVPCVIDAIRNEWAVNFLDSLSAVMGTTLTHSLRDRANDIFNTIEPPTASCALDPHQAYGGGGAGAYGPPPPVGTGVGGRMVSMATVNTQHGGCFLGDGLVLMADGTEKRIDQLQAGDRVASAGAGAGATSTVGCVVKTEQDGADVVRLGHGHGTAFTPWHPVLIQDDWVFPLSLGPVVHEAADAVYNFVLDAGHMLLLNGVVACTLGHNFNGPIIGHPYFGDRVQGKRNVRDDLEADEGWSTGYIVFRNMRVERDPESGDVCGMSR